MEGKMMDQNEIRAFLAGDGKEPITAVSLSNFVKSGMPQVERGVYDPIACAHWYLGQLRERKGMPLLPRTRKAALEAIMSVDFRETLRGLVREVQAEISPNR